MKRESGFILVVVVFLLDLGLRKSVFLLLSLLRNIKKMQRAFSPTKRSTHKNQLVCAARGNGFFSRSSFRWGLTQQIHCASSMVSCLLNIANALVAE